jgi:hypothetical protein
MLAETRPHVIQPLVWRYTDLPHATRLSLSTLARLRERGALPEPDLKIGRALCWYPATIERFLAEYGR